MCCCHCQHLFYLFFILLLEPVATTSTALSANFGACSYELAFFGSVITVTRKVAFPLLLQPLNCSTFHLLTLKYFGDPTGTRTPFTR